MDEPPPRRDAGRPRPPARETWTRIGYAATAAWMLAVIVATSGDPGHPWFDYIFIVPLACWIVGAVVARVFAALKARRGRS